MTDELMAALKDIEHVARTRRIMAALSMEKPEACLDFIAGKAKAAIVRAEDPFAGREPGIHSSYRSPEERERERQEVHEQNTRRAKRESQEHDRESCRCWACIYLRSVDGIEELKE